MNKPPPCETCPYFENPHDPEEEDHVGHYGYCHRHAPSPPVIDELQDGGHNDPMVYLWPRTHFGDWCGEHPNFQGWMIQVAAADQVAATSGTAGKTGR